MSDSPRLVHDLARDVRLIAGADEVGRASLAGPIMAAGVLFDIERLAGEDATRAFLNELNDSKRLSHSTRERLAQDVLLHAEVVSLVSVPAGQIDRDRIDPANATCLEGALTGVGERAQLRLVDGDGRRPLGASAPAHEWIPQGDATSATIAAASIVAKVARDQLMARLGERYPAYGFERHNGYGTPEHLAAIAELERIPGLHRMSFNIGCSTDDDVAADVLTVRPEKPGRATLRELPTKELARYLLETPTISDGLWTDERRLPRETRTAFIHRLLLGETNGVDREV